MLEEKKRQMRRSNERLRMLEEMERQKQSKIELEIQKLNQDKQRREDQLKNKKTFHSQK